jgi:hypothetical protein
VIRDQVNPWFFQANTCLLFTYPYKQGFISVTTGSGKISNVHIFGNGTTVTVVPFQAIKGNIKVLFYPMFPDFLPSMFIEGSHASPARPSARAAYKRE